MPVIMSGGAGTRLWPLSTDHAPKQFHPLGSERTMLQDTVLRVRGPEFLDPIVICNLRHGGEVRAQLAAVGVEPTAIVLEPFGRNTAAVAVAAALAGRRFAPDALVLLAPADHVVSEPARFRATVLAAGAQSPDRIVTFGIEPTGPETGFGYIQSSDDRWGEVRGIRRFVEKPDRQTAEAFLASGDYLWNAGIFLYRPEVLLAEALAHCPDIVSATDRAMPEGVPGGDIEIDGAAFADCPAQPVDIAVMEKTGLGAVMPSSFGWADIGSWSELWKLGEKDGAGNVSRGDAAMIATEASLVWSTGPTVSIIGLSDVMVIATPDHVLVLPKDRAQDVKKIVELRKARP